MGEVTGWGFKVQLDSVNRGGSNASLREITKIVLSGQSISCVLTKQQKDETEALGKKNERIQREHVCLGNPNIFFLKSLSEIKYYFKPKG